MRIGYDKDTTTEVSVEVPSRTLSSNRLVVTEEELCRLASFYSVSLRYVND